MVFAIEASPPKNLKKRQLDATGGPTGDAAAPGGVPRGRGQRGLLGGAKAGKGGGEGPPGRKRGREPPLEPIEDSLGPDDSETPIAELVSSNRKGGNGKDKAGGAAGAKSSVDQEEGGGRGVHRFRGEEGVRKQEEEDR